MSRPGLTDPWVTVNGASPPSASSARQPGPADLPHRSTEDAKAEQRLRQRLLTDLRQRLNERMTADQRAGRAPMSVAQRRQWAEPILQRLVDDHVQDEMCSGRKVVTLPEVEQRVMASVLDDLIFGLAGLAPLLADPDIENININGDRVFVEYAGGRRECKAPVVASDDELVELIRDLATHSGEEERRFDRGSPIVNFQLEGGERVSAVMAVTKRPSVSIRRHRFRKVTLRQLRDNGTIDLALEAFLTAMVRAKRNVLVTGGTAIGKTTMLRALASAIPPWERLITIEDVFELGLDVDDDAHPDVVAMQARDPNIEGQGEITMSDLMRQSLRMSPDRVIVGEVRGPEAGPMLKAMSIGNDGSMATLHASSSLDAVDRLATCLAESPERLDMKDINRRIASAVHFIVHLEKPRDDPGKRVVSSIREVAGCDDNHVLSNEVWRPGLDLRALPCGAALRTETLDRLVDAGYDPDLAERREGWWRP
jgi:pilus assembly protein CpaF